MVSLSGIHGGITLEQYETIKEISHIEVAAPIAMIGYLDYGINVALLKLTEKGRIVIELRKLLMMV